MLGVLDAADLATGSHACCLFHDTEHKRTVLTRFFAKGIDTGERVAYYAHGDPEPVEFYLPGYDAQALVDTGALVVGSAHDAYFPDGKFDGPARAADFAQFARATVDDGFAGLRVYADNGWMPAALPDPREWLEYELRIALTVPALPLIGLCGFNGWEPRPISAGTVDAVHHDNVSVHGRPSAFHVSGTADGALRLVGEMDTLSLETVRLVLAAAVETDMVRSFSLAGLEFVDAAAGDLLYEAITAIHAGVLDKSSIVDKVWRLLGHNPSLLNGHG